jgi:hypothetical protein
MAAEDTRQEVLDRVGATFCEFLEVLSWPEHPDIYVGS